MITHGPYNIVPKRDCNAAKGATWFRTVEQAKAAIDEGTLIDSTEKINSTLDGN